MMTPTGKNPIVFTSGHFDDMRTTDIRFLQEAAKLGSVHALISSDEAAHKIDGGKTKFPLKERRYFLENVRFIGHTSVIETTNQDQIPFHFTNTDHKKLIWAVREGDVNNEKGAFCADHGITRAVIPESALAGFPIIENPHKPSRKKVMVSGCFDWVHSGHVRFFEEAAEYGDLYVVVGHDQNLRLLKGESHPLFTQEERQYWVHAIRFVHTTLISSGHGWLDAEPEVVKYKPDIFIVNHDGDKTEKRELFRQMGIEYKVLERKPKRGLTARESSKLRGF